MIKLRLSFRNKGSEQKIRVGHKQTQIDPFEFFKDKEKIKQ